MSNCEHTAPFPKHRLKLQHLNITLDVATRAQALYLFGKIQPPKVPEIFTDLEKLELLLLQLAADAHYNPWDAELSLFKKPYYIEYEQNLEHIRKTAKARQFPPVIPETQSAE